MILKVKKILIITILFLIRIIHSSSIPKLEKDNNFNFQKTKLLRILKRKEINLEEVCSRSNKDVRDFFEYGNYVPNFIDNEDTKYVETIINILGPHIDTYNNKNLYFHKSYFKRTYPALSIVLIGIIVVFLWPISICCLCNCNCCCCFCCCEKVNKKWKIFFFFFSGAAFILCFIMCIYSSIILNKAFREFDNASCTFFKVLTQEMEGVSKNITPKWGGINRISNMLLNLSNVINNDRNTLFEDYKNAVRNIEIAQEEFVNSLTNNIYGSNANGIEVIGPDSSTSYSKVIPEYALNYGPKETTETLLYKINNEYTRLTSKIMESINEASNYIDSIFSDNNFETDLYFASNYVFVLEQAFDKLMYYIAYRWNEFQPFFPRIKKIMKNWLYITMVLSLGITSLYFINYMNECRRCDNLLKVFTTILWNLLYLFSWLLYIMIGVIGMIAIIGKDYSNIVSYLISEENLTSEEPKILQKIEAVDYLNICVNGDGNLKEKLNLGVSMDDLNNLYSLYDTLNSHITTLSNHKQIEIINEVFTSKNYDKKFLDCKYYVGDRVPKYEFYFSNWFDILNKYTSTNYGNYQTGPLYYDEYWGITTSQHGYEYYNTVSNAQANQNSKYLLNLYDRWTGTFVESRYAALGGASGGSYSSVKNAAKDIINKFRDVENNMKTSFFTPTKNQNNIINRKFKDVSDKMIITLKKAISIIDSVHDIVGEYLANEYHSFDYIINCSYLGLHYKFLLTQVHKSLGGGLLYNFIYSTLAMTVFLSIGLYSSIFYMVIVKKVHDFKEEKN